MIAERAADPGPRPAVSRQPFVQSRYTATDGLSLYFRDYGPRDGSKPAILCLAGLTRTSRDFYPLATALRGEHRLICPDYRGRGLSQYDPCWRRYEIRTYAEDIRHLLAALDIEQVVAIGTSMGGLLAMALALAIPTKLKAAVLNDIGPEIDPGGWNAIIRYMTADRAVADWATAVERLKQAFPDLPARSEEDWLEIARGAYREEGTGLVADWDAAILKPLRRLSPAQLDLWRLYRSLGSRPVLVLRGETSAILSVEVLRRMGETLPHAACFTVPGVGHAPSLVEPISLKAIRELLDTH